MNETHKRKAKNRVLMIQIRSIQGGGVRVLPCSVYRVQVRRWSTLEGPSWQALFSIIILSGLHPDSCKPGKRGPFGYKIQRRFPSITKLFVSPRFS